MNHKTIQVILSLKYRLFSVSSTFGNSVVGDEVSKAALRIVGNAVGINVGVIVVGVSIVVSSKNGSYIKIVLYNDPGMQSDGIE